MPLDDDSRAILLPPPLTQLIAGLPYGPAFANRLRAIHSDLPVQLANADQLGDTILDDVICCALSFACEAQNVANIMLGRAALLALPRDAAKARIVGLARAVLNLADPWEVRRFLEVLLGLDYGVCRAFATAAYLSTDPEIREAAEDALAFAPDIG